MGNQVNSDTVKANNMPINQANNTKNRASREQDYNVKKQYQN